MWFYGPKPFPFISFSSISSLCEVVLRQFSKKDLSMGSGSVYNDPMLSHPLEAHFQVKLCRTFYSPIENGLGISSKWTRAGDGGIDPRITEPRWETELHRDGGRLSEHCSWLLLGAAYHRWIIEVIIPKSPLILKISR